MRELDKPFVSEQCLLYLPYTAQLAVPRSVVQQGRAAVREWIFTADHVALPRIKLLLLGHGRSGKTTLVQALKLQLGGGGGVGGDRALHESQLLGMQSTMGVAITAPRDFPLHRDIRFQVYDFAGQLEYLTAHQYFLSTTNAVYLLVVNVSLSRDELCAQLDHWAKYVRELLDADIDNDNGEVSGEGGDVSGARTKAPQFVVQVVGTQLDKLHSEAARGEAQYALQQWIAQCRLPVAPNALLVSSVEASDGGGLQQVLQQVSKLAEQLLAQHRTIRLVPKSYVAAAQRLEQDGAESLGALHPIVRVEQMASLLAPAVEWSAGVGEFLHNTGQVALSPSRRLVCLQPQTLGKLMAAFVGSDEHRQRLQVNQQIRATANATGVDDSFESDAIMSVEALERTLESRLKAENLSQVLCTALR